jgi:hypothetical protein
MADCEHGCTCLRCIAAHLARPSGETPAPPVPVGGAVRCARCQRMVDGEGDGPCIGIHSHDLRSSSPEPPAPDVREGLDARIERWLADARAKFGDGADNRPLPPDWVWEAAWPLLAEALAALRAPAEAAPTCPPLKVGDAVSYRDEVDSVVVKIEQSGTLPNGEHYESYAVTEDKAVVVPSDIVRLERDGVLIWEDTTP